MFELPLYKGGLSPDDATDVELLDSWDEMLTVRLLDCREEIFSIDTPDVELLDGRVELLASGRPGVKTPDNWAESLTTDTSDFALLDGKVKLSISERPDLKFDSGRR